MNISSTIETQLLIAKLVSADDDLTKAAFALVSAKKKKCKICHGDHDLSYYSTNAEKKLIDANNMIDSMVIKKNKIQKEWFEIAKKNMLLADANELNDFYTQQTCETVKWVAVLNGHTICICKALLPSFHYYLYYYHYIK